MQSGDIIVERPRGVWGHPSSVTVETWANLPEPMRAEGARMLLEMGVTEEGVRRQLQLSSADFCTLMRPGMAPHKRLEPDFAVPAETGRKGA